MPVAGPTVTFPAAEHHCPLAGTKLSVTAREDFVDYMNEDLVAAVVICGTVTCENWYKCHLVQVHKETAIIKSVCVCVFRSC